MRAFTSQKGPGKGLPASGFAPERRGLPSLKIGVEYAIGGEALPRGYMPASLDELARVDVRYVELPGWTEDLSLCRAFADLPANARRYVRAVEEALGGLRISWVGVGPGRDDMFVMPGVH